MTTWNGHRTCQHAIYRITCEQYERMLARADGHCEICGIAVEDTPDNRLGIDHDHTAGDGWDHVRGMLCTKCNCNLKYPERGEREYTPAEAAYMARAWHVVEPPPAPPAPDTPANLTIKSTRARRVGLAQATKSHRASRDDVLNQLIDWYLRTPGAKLPRRP